MATPGVSPAFRSFPARCWLFYGLTLVISWGWWGHMWLTGQTVAPGSAASHLPGLAGPMIAACLVSVMSEGRAGLIHLARRVALRRRRPWFQLLAIGAPIVVAVTGLALGAGGDRQSLFAYPGVPAMLSPVAGVALVIMLNGLGEEMGWRGFLFDRLNGQMSPFAATTWVTLLWAIWHVPLFFVHQGMADLVGPMLIGWLLGLASGSFLLSYLYRESGRSIGYAALWHSVYNYCVATPAMQGTIAAIVSTMVMIAGFMIAWRWWRARGVVAPN